MEYPRGQESRIQRPIRKEFLTSTSQLLYLNRWLRRSAEAIVPTIRHPESCELFHGSEVMLFGWVRIAQDHLNARVSEHRGERNEIDPGHGSASRPGMTKIVESKCRNRTLVCFRSDAVD